MIRPNLKLSATNPTQTDSTKLQNPYIKLNPNKIWLDLNPTWTQNEETTDIAQPDLG